MATLDSLVEQVPEVDYLNLFVSSLKLVLNLIGNIHS
jgi:hypothetical protein